MLTKRLLLAVAVGLVLNFAGMACSTPTIAESVRSTSARDTAGVDCTMTQMQAYQSGSPFTISVFTISGKRVAKPTGDAFLKMRDAAEAAGVSITINSGFRTQEEQQHLYNCYTTKSCNNGNLAAKPGYSNHQNGKALDLTTSDWLVQNAATYGFSRTVPSEAWHYEFNGADPGGQCDGDTTDTPATDTGNPATTDSPDAAAADPSTFDPSLQDSADGGTFDPNDPDDTDPNDPYADDQDSADPNDPYSQDPADDEDYDDDDGYPDMCDPNDDCDYA